MGVPAAGELDDQLVEAVDDDVVVAGERVAQVRLALVDGEQGLLAQGWSTTPTITRPNLRRPA